MRPTPNPDFVFLPNNRNETPENNQGLIQEFGNGGGGKCSVLKRDAFNVTHSCAGGGRGGAGNGIPLLQKSQNFLKGGFKRWCK